MPRHDDRRRRLERAVLGAALALVCLGAATAAERTARRAGVPAERSRDWVRIVAADDTGLEIELQAGEPQLADGVFALPGFATGGEPGLPQWFEQAVTIAVPSARGARLEVQSSRTRDLGTITAPRMPAPTPRPERDAASATGKPASEWQDVAPRAVQAVVPAAPVALGGIARLRGRDIVTLHYLPLQHRPDGGATFTAQVRLRVVFADRATAAAAPLEARRESFHESLLNARQAASWAIAAPPAATGKRAEIEDLPAERVRIRLNTRGLYELQYADLNNVIPNLGSIDLRTFKLYMEPWKELALPADSIPASWQPGYEMEQLAIRVHDATGNTFFDAGDLLQFYALGAAGYEEVAGASTDSLAFYRHPYDKDRYAWLVWGGDFGTRIQDQDVAPGDSASATPTTRAWHREHFEADEHFDSVDDLWYWEEIRRTRPSLQRFGLDLGGEATAVADLRVAFAHSAPGGQRVIDVVLNGRLLGTENIFLAGHRARRVTYTNVMIRNGTDTLLCRAQPTHTAPGTYLMEFDIGWNRPLRRPAGAPLGWTDRTGRTHLTEISGFGSQPPHVLDVTDPRQPVRLVGLVAGSGAGTWRLWHGRGASRRIQYWATDSPINLGGSDVVFRRVATLRTQTTAPDMLIVTHSTLLNAANRLANHRRAHYPGGGTPDIKVVTTQDIYDNFSGGRQDPAAIRNYVKFLYLLDQPVPRLRYLCLFGDGNRDYRQEAGSSPQELVPPIVPGAISPNLIRDSHTAYAVDDWFGEMETPRNGIAPFPVPDVALGRLAARSPSDADRIVDKIIAYDSAEFGPWKTRVLMTADDEHHPGAPPTETFHIGNTESLCRLVPRDLDVVKFYETEYPMTLGQKPQARAAFIRSWSEGCVVLNFQGHGAPRQLTDEVLFLSTDIPALTNGVKLPLFLPVSCTVSEFEDPERQSMCEDLISSSSGGAIATVGATTPTFVGPNFTFNLEIFEQLFADGATSRIPLGEVHIRTKAGSPISSGSFNETYTLLADPSMHLQLPQALVRFTSGLDSLATGARARIQGEVYDVGDSLRLAGFDGEVEIEVRGTNDTSGYRRPPPDNLFIAYHLPGPHFYRGTAPVRDGQFAFQFIVPVGAHGGNLGRVSAYAAGGTTDARGELEDVRIVVAPPADSSLGAPRISLRFPNDRTRVKAGTPLTAEIRDENGINIQGTSLRNSIYLDFDNRNEPLNVTSQFRYAEGSDSVGTVTVPLPSDLEPGAHEATLIASDNLLNTATAKVGFQVVAEEVVQLVNVLAFPNPFKDWTRFMFEITDPGEVEIEVFTPNGRPVWSRKERFAAATQGSMKWDGVDLEEDTLANGTYLFRVRVRPDQAGSPTLEKIGKVVIMR